MSDLRVLTWPTTSNITGFVVRGGLDTSVPITTETKEPHQ